MSGKLYLVATPIGNLEDITLRAIKILKEVDLIAAEDTRHTLKLLNHLQMNKPLISYYKEIENTKSDILIEKLIKGENIALVSDAGTPGISDPGEKINKGENIALVSDAGTPAISDPGEVIVKEAIKENIEVIPIPGACAAINALIASGLDTTEFAFFGFLPLNKKLRKEKLDEIKNENKTVIIYEAPHKLTNTLQDLKQIVENRNIVLARELTKIHEEFIRGNIDEVISKTDSLKGEMIILIEGTIKEERENPLNELTLGEHYEFYKSQGLDKKDIIKNIAKDKGVNKNEIYMHFINKK